MVKKTALSAMSIARPVWVSVALFVCLASGCTTSKSELDPFEPFNRSVHHFNETVDSWVLRPVAVGYRKGIPQPVRERVRNALSNLNHPMIFANDLLQGEWERAGIALVRFLINSTWGIAGLHDVAHEMGFEPHTEDFGQTLAVAGVDSGPHLVIPLIGPSNVRDAAGIFVDWVLDPIRLHAHARSATEGMHTRIALEFIDEHAFLIDVLDDVARTSLDTYLSYRTLYIQRRESEIKNFSGETAVDAEAFDFDDFEEYP